LREMFKDRIEAGRLLGKAVAKLNLKNPIVLGIPRGGVVVAAEVARAIEAPLDLIITRKIGAPGNPELAVGAVTQDGEPIVDHSIARELGIGKKYLQQEANRQAIEIKERTRKYRGNRPYPALEGKSVIIVDDGVATGSTTLAAIISVKKKKPASVILSVPVAPPDTIHRLSREVNKVICLSTPEHFYAIGEFYESFEQVEDDEVRRILKEANEKMK
jgi:putative phosphoribosyl transferase